MENAKIERQYMGKMTPFRLAAPFQPMGDQPEAVKSLTDGLRDGHWAQVLLGATGTGKTFTMAKVIEEMQRPTLIISPNKTLAAQTASEFKDFFPDNAVYYFVSYYDYFQPESYIPQTDTYIEKDSSRNEEIDRLRHSATMALFERRDVIVASVSCIYGLGDPEDYSTLGLSLRPGEKITRDQILSRLVDMQYLRNDLNFTRDTFRVRGDTIDVFPASSNNTAVRIEMFGDEILGIDLPTTVELEVTETEPGVKGDTAQGATKAATVETGYTLQVPLFVKEGDVLVINTSEGTYVSRA